jgi:hypothetical protein
MKLREVTASTAPYFQLVPLGQEGSVQLCNVRRGGQIPT